MGDIPTDICTWPSCAHTAKGQCKSDLGIILRNPPDSYGEWMDAIRICIQWEKVKVLLEGLNQIAAWHEGPIVNGSFDEPASARTARQTLERYNAVG